MSVFMRESDIEAAVPLSESTRPASPMVMVYHVVVSAT